jgi:hypothetical protein
MQNLLRTAGRPVHATLETGQLRFTLLLDPTQSVPRTQSRIENVA